MINLELTERIWSDANIHPDYLEELKKVCTPPGDLISPGAHTLSSLPTIFCRLFGGDEKALTPIITAWNILRVTARMLDDLQDNPKYQDKSLPIRLNLTTGLLFTTSSILSELEKYQIDSSTASKIRKRFAEAGLKTCSGQHLDLSATDLSLDECWKLVEAKSGTALGLICWAGARLGTNEEAPLHLAYQFGLQLGLLDQISDDLRDLWSSENSQTDLKRLHVGTLPIVYTRSVLAPDAQNVFLENLERARLDPNYEEMVRTKVIESGSALYLAVQSTVVYNRAIALIKKLQMPTDFSEILTAFLDQISFVKSA